MSRGPGATERGVLAALSRYGPMNATELAQDIFGLWGTLKLEPTAAQIGSVRQAIRHLTARGVIIEEGKTVSEPGAIVRLIRHKGGHQLFVELG